MLLAGDNPIVVPEMFHVTLYAVVLEMGSWRLVHYYLTAEPKEG
jgi:hypothetical protein